MLDVGTTTLHEVTGESLPVRLRFFARQIVRHVGEGRVEHAEQRVERGLVATVRGRGDEQQVLTVLGREVLQQRVALVAAAAGGTRVGLVDDDEVGCAAQEGLAAAIALDEVERDDGVWVAVEQRLPGAAGAFQTGRRAGEHQRCVDVELAQ